MLVKDLFWEGNIGFVLGGGVSVHISLLFLFLLFFLKRRE